MDIKLLTTLKKALIEKKEMLIKQLESIGSRVSKDGENENFEAKFPDYGDSQEDNAVEVADYAKNLSLERNLESDLEGTEKALDTMEKGTYGICSYCGKPIEVERLKIRPESTSCVACKNALKS
jgi:RNA polymerase-binding transcription factor DksA